MKRVRIMPRKCPLCESGIDNAEIVSNYVYGGTSVHKFYLCKNCDVAFLYPGMSKEEEKRFYSNEFEKFMEKRAGQDFDWSGPEAHIRSNEKQYQRRLRFFRDLLNHKKIILEIGCSSGFMLLPLREAGMEAVGVEPSGKFTSFLKRQDIPVYNSLESLKRSEFQRRKFDLILHFFVLEHIRNPIRFLKEALGLLKPGGTMIFEVPSRSDPLLTIYNIPAFNKFYWSIAHNYYFNKKSLEYILKQIGYNYNIMAEQRYDLSNHFTWACYGKPGGQDKYSQFFTRQLEASYLESMIKTGHCDTLIARIDKDGAV